METVHVDIKRLRPHAKLPERATDGAAGFDLCAIFPQHHIDVTPDHVLAIPTGLAIAVPRGWECQIRLRSGLGKAGLFMPNAPGTIDSDYRGELFVLVANIMKDPYRIYHGDRIAQMLIKPVLQVEFHEVADLVETDRGSGAFGSTGK